MKIKTQDYNDFTVIELQGDFDNDFVEIFQNNITEIMTEDRNGIVIDMQNVDFIDSEGLERLLWARDYCNENHCQLRFAALQENCQKILEITRLENEFDCYKLLDEAVKNLT